MLGIGIQTEVDAGYEQTLDALRDADAGNGQMLWIGKQTDADDDYGKMLYRVLCNCTVILLFIFALHWKGKALACHSKLIL
jgi:hypothetical protein